jgi:hypothetical protein
LLVVSSSSQSFFSSSSASSSSHLIFSHFIPVFSYQLFHSSHFIFSIYFSIFFFSAPQLLSFYASQLLSSSISSNTANMQFKSILQCLLLVAPVFMGGAKAITVDELKNLDGASIQLLRQWNAKCFHDCVTACHNFASTEAENDACFKTNCVPMAAHGRCLRPFKNNRRSPDDVPTGEEAAAGGAHPHPHHHHKQPSRRRAPVIDYDDEEEYVY